MSRPAAQELCMRVSQSLILASAVNRILAPRESGFDAGGLRFGPIKRSERAIKQRMAYLSIRSEGRRSRRYDLTDTVVLGRTVWCDIKFDDAGLSKQHCRVERKGETWYLVDLESPNGTFVNGEPIL